MDALQNQPEARAGFAANLFSQVALAHAARTFRSYGAEVEVVGIPSERDTETGEQAA